MATEQAAGEEAARPAGSGGPDGSTFIEVENLGFEYRGAERAALEGVNLAIKEGEFACVLGPSGCGKSTLLNILSGLYTPTSGNVRIANELIYESGRRVIDEPPRVGYVFQDARLLPWRTVRQNLELALEAASWPKAEWSERIERYLTLCGIEEYVDAWPSRLSGGQQQRVSIARALALDPMILLMDEPFSTLDEVTGRFLRGELLDIWSRTEKTIAFITHSIREAVFLADHIYVMTAGPGRILDRITIEMPRPRKYEDPHLTEIEGSIVESVLGHWGYYDQDRAR